MKKSRPQRQPSAVHRALVRNDLPFKGRAEELRTRLRLVAVRVPWSESHSQLPSKRRVVERVAADRQGRALGGDKRERAAAAGVSVEDIAVTVNAPVASVQDRSGTSARCASAGAAASQRRGRSPPRPRSRRAFSRAR